MFAKKNGMTKERGDHVSSPPVSKPVYSLEAVMALQKSLENGISGIAGHNAPENSAEESHPCSSS
jgi:hypothetical protein